MMAEQQHIQNKQSQNTYIYIYIYILSYTRSHKKVITKFHIIKLAKAASGGGGWITSSMFVP